MLKLVKEEVQARGYFDILKTDYCVKVFYRDKIFLQVNTSYKITIEEIRTLLLQGDTMGYVSMVDACKILVGLGEEEYYDE